MEKPVPFHCYARRSSFDEATQLAKELCAIHTGIQLADVPHYNRELGRHIIELTAPKEVYEEFFGGRVEWMNEYGGYWRDVELPRVPKPFKSRITAICMDRSRMDTAH